MNMPGRSYSIGGKYRYGFNGQENSDEIAAGLTTAMYWEYDSRIGRRWNVDPVLKEWESPYACFNGNPIMLSDLLGDNASTPDNWVGTKDEEGNTVWTWVKGIETVDQAKALTQFKDKDIVGVKSTYDFDNTQGGRTYLWADGTFVNKTKEEDEESKKFWTWNNFKASMKMTSGIQEFDIYSSVQLKATWSQDNVFWLGPKSEGKIVVPFGIQGGYSTENKGLYYDLIGPKNTYLNYGMKGVVEGRVSKGESDRGDYAKFRGLLTVYQTKGVKVQLDAVFNPKDIGSIRVGARTVFEKTLFETNTPLAPSISVEGAAGFRVKYTKPWWFVGLMPIPWGNIF
jgi:hypothetical protein